jgi:hypothetical protein
MIIEIEGDQGSGKTLTLVLAARMYLHDGFSIFVNFPLNEEYIPYTPIKTIADLQSATGGLLAMDEFYTWMDSRGSQTKQNKAASYLIFYTRKKMLDFFYTTHRFGHVDKRVRRLTDRRLMPMMSLDKRMCRVRVYARTWYSDEEFVEIKQFTFKTQPLFDLFDTHSGIFRPEDIELGEKPEEKLITAENT